MSSRIILAVLGALGTGTAIALQTTMNGRAGGVIGPIRTGLLVNATGGSMAIALVLLTILAGRLGLTSAEALNLTDRGATPLQILSWVAVAGFLGILIIVGISFSVQGVGVTAGLSAVILSQLVVGLLIDSVGGAGGLAIAINLRRLAGIVAMALGVWLLVPRPG